MQPLEALSFGFCIPTSFFLALTDVRLCKMPRLIMSSLAWQREWPLDTKIRAADGLIATRLSRPLSRHCGQSRTVCRQSGCLRACLYSPGVHSGLSPLLTYICLISIPLRNRLTQLSPVRTPDPSIITGFSQNTFSSYFITSFPLLPLQQVYII